MRVLSSCSFAKLSQLVLITLRRDEVVMVCVCRNKTLNRGESILNPNPHLPPSPTASGPTMFQASPVGKRHPIPQKGAFWRVDARCDLSGATPHYRQWGWVG